MEGAINRVARLARLGYFCCLGLVILAIFTINPVSISGDEANATTGTATSANTSLSLTTNHDNAVVTITPNSANGTFAMSSTAGEAQFGVTTNNFTGYELSIVADDDNGNLVNIDNGNTHTISSIPSSITKSSFDTTTYNNKWGYKPSKYLGPNSTIVTNTGDSALFLPSPTTTGTILDHTTVANSSANNYSIALGVRADYNTYAGSYTKNFTLAVIANPTTYIIDYNKNTSDTVTNMPTAQSSATSATSITLASNTPERENYNFLGWCTVQTVDSSCSGTTYQPGDTYGLDQTTANTVTLYAMWELEKFTITLATSGGANGIVIDGVNYTSSVSLAYGSTHTISGSYASGYEFSSWSASGSISVASTSSASTTLTVSGAGTLTLNGKQSTSPIQTIVPDTCPTEPTAVIDPRDGEVYTIQKLADGKCWLLDNLRLDLTNSAVLNALSASNTNASNATLNYLKNGGGSGRYATAKATNKASSTTRNVPVAIATYKNNTVGYGSGSGKIGIYYNYCAASAGGYCYPYSSTGNADEDICPKDWRMPTGGSNGEYQALYEAYNSDYYALRNALHATLSGFASENGSKIYSQGSEGYFWASNRVNDGSMYSMILGQNINLYGTFRYHGLSVRCVLDPPFNYTISYNKNTASVVSNMPSTQTGTTNSAKAIELSNNIPSRSGYYFLGWCDTQPTTSNNIDSCPGAEFIPGGEYVANTVSNIILYAMWEILPSLAIQNVTSSTCPTTSTKVYDTRDNEIYTIQKLADGKCWLLDNLRLDFTNSTVKNNLTASTTNASNATLNYLKNGGGTTSDQYATAGIANWVSSYSYSAPLINTASKYATQSYGSGSGKIGVYYNYCAASAGSYCYGNGTSAGSPSGNATEDICPKGWRMPTGDSSGEYQALYTAYSSNATNFSNALRVPLSGYLDRGDSVATGQGSAGYGYLWSSTCVDSSATSYYYTYMYQSRSSSSYMTSSSWGSRYTGASVRCVLK